MTKIVLTPTAAALFPDLASRVDGWAVTTWERMHGQVWLPREMIEEVRG